MGWKSFHQKWEMRPSSEIQIAISGRLLLPSWGTIGWHKGVQIIRNFSLVEPEQLEVMESVSWKALLLFKLSLSLLLLELSDSMKAQLEMCPFQWMNTPSEARKGGEFPQSASTFCGSKCLMKKHSPNSGSAQDQFKREFNANAFTHAEVLYSSFEQWTLKWITAHGSLLASLWHIRLAEA